MMITHLIIKNKIYLKIPFDLKDVIKQVPGRRWHPEKKLWSVPYDEDSTIFLNNLFKINIPAPEIVRVKDVEKTPATDLVLKNLYKHQKQSVTVGRKTKTFADTSEPGTGKTLVQIELMLERNQWPGLVICPKSIMEPVWQEQLDENGIEEAYILNGGSKKIKQALKMFPDMMEIKGLEKEPFVIIINYEMVPLVLDELLEIKWKFIICDESTKIKSPNAKRSKAVMKLRDRVFYRSIMTGTIAPNGLQDAFNQYRFVNPNIFGESFYAFRYRYFHQGGYMNYEWFPNPDSIIKFKEKVRGITIQHHKRDCIDLPPMVEEIRKVEMNSYQRDLYEQMKEEAIIWLSNYDEKSGHALTAPFVMTQLMKLRQIASGFIYSENEVYSITKNNPKDTVMTEIIEQLGNQKCIVFAHFNNSLNHLSEYLQDKYEWTWFSGNEKMRNEALDQFKNKAQILIANPASAGHGLNLQFCSNIIYYELDFNLENHLQSMQRIERIGQKNKMTVYHIIAKHTIEEYIYKKLKHKENINKKLDLNELKNNL